MLMMLTILGGTANIFVACNGNGDRRLVTIVVYSQLAADGMQTGYFASVLEYKFGVRMQIVGDTGGERFPARSLTRDLGDIVIFDSMGANFQDAVGSGLLLDWESRDLLQNYGSNLMKFFAGEGGALEANRQVVNQIHGLPENRRDRVFGIGHSVTPSEWSMGRESFFYNWDIRWDIFRQTDFYGDNPRQLVDMNDYLDLMIQMREVKSHDDYGNPMFAVSMWSEWDDAMIMYVKSMASAFYGYEEFGIGLVDIDARHNPDNPNCEFSSFVYHDALYATNPLDPTTFGPYLRMLQWFNRLHQHRLIDPESLTQDFDTMVGKMTRGSVFTSLFNFAGNMQFNTPENLERNRMLTSLAPSGARTISYASSPYGGERVWAIGSRTSHPELAMQIIDFFFSPEGAMTRLYGIRGVHWDYNEDGSISFTDLGRTSFSEQGTDQAGAIWTTQSGREIPLSGLFRDGIPMLNNSGWSMDAFNPDSAAIMREYTGNPNATGDSFNWEFWASEQVESDFEVERSWQAFTGVNNRQEHLQSRNYSIIPAAIFSPQRLGTLQVNWNSVTHTIRTSGWRAIFAENDAAFENIVSAMIRDAHGRNYLQLTYFNRNEVERKFGRTLDCWPQWNARVIREGRPDLVRN